MGVVPLVHVVVWYVQNCLNSMAFFTNLLYNKNQNVWNDQLKVSFGKKNHNGVTTAKEKSGNFFSFFMLQNPIG